MPDKNATEKITVEASPVERFPHINKKFAIAVISIFIAMLLLPTLIWGALAIFSPATVEALDFDTGENRAKSEFPKKFDPQSFTSEVEAWYNDHLPFRSVLYTTQENMSSSLEKPYVQKLRGVLIQIFHHQATPSPTPSDDEEILELPTSLETEVLTETETETLPIFVIETETEGIQVCQHVYAEEAITLKEATCTDWGIEGYPCTLCDAVGNKQYTKKAAHDYLSNDPYLPSCGLKYEETFTCSACNDSYTKTKTKQHVYGVEIKTVEATESTYGYKLIQCSDCLGQYRTELVARKADNTYLPPIAHDLTLEGKYNWLFYMGNDSIGFYQGSNLLPVTTLHAYVEVLQQLQDICDEKGIELAIAFWPNKEMIYSEFMPEYPIYEKVKRVEHMTAYIRSSTTVTTVYPLAELRAAKPYWQVYFKHDTHWNSAGAFIGLQELYAAMGIETTSLMYLPVTEVAKSGGDLINIGKLSASDYTGDVNYNIKYREEVSVTSADYTPISTDTTHTYSNGPIDKNFVMLSDSFRVAMKPFLQKDFTSCFLTHRNRVNDADVIAAIKEADILVISTVERNDQNVIVTAQRIIEILTEDDQ